MNLLNDPFNIRGIYVHIPYCLQRCHYCDFATYKFDEIPPSKNYFSLLQTELSYLQRFFAKGLLNSVYFGGGTPSLAEPSELAGLLSAFKELGFLLNSETEITIEINPATITPEKMETYLKVGINRFSVGAQTFNDSKLKLLGREHNVLATRETLKLLKSYDVNYSFDLLYALPNQTHEELLVDLEEINTWQPPHISPYCLTLPDKHFLQKNRPIEDVQIKMFETLNSYLIGAGYNRYEISNFAKPGFESKHNKQYWNQSGFWGLGLSAYSFLSYGPAHPFGFRFWNPKSYEAYAKEVENLKSLQSDSLKGHFSGLSETLEEHEALTEYCYTALRQSTGLRFDEFSRVFNSKLWPLITKPLLRHVESGLIILEKNKNFYLSEQGVMVSNMIFADLTFLKEDLSLGGLQSV